MDIKVIKGVENYLYDDDIEFRALNPGHDIIGNWRKGASGDWVFTDDMYVLQIIKRSAIKHPGYKIPRNIVLTVCGSFVVEQRTHQILGEHGVAEKIYTFSGNYDAIYERAKKRKLNNREFLFARYVAAGDNTLSAYKKAYPKAKDEKYIKKKTNSSHINVSGIYNTGSDRWTTSTERYILSHGDAILFDGESQMTSTHAVPEVLNVGERINLTFRSGL